MPLRNSRAPALFASVVAKLGRHLALVLLAALALGAGPARAQGPPTEPPLGVHESYFGDAAGFFSSLDPVSLAPAQPAAEVPEWHDGWSFSPGRSQIAFGISTGAPVNPGPGTSRVGIRIIDVASRQILGDVRLGGFASRLAWFEPRRLVALQGSRSLVVDPLTRTIVKSRSVSGSGCGGEPPWGRTPRALVTLPGKRLVAVDRDGRGRSVALRGLPDACGTGSRARRSGLAVDSAGQRAFVLGTAATVPEVDLRTMRARYHRVPASRASAVKYSHGVWLGGRRLAVAHQNSRWVPRGVELLDLPAGRRRTLDEGAGGVAFAAGRILTFDGRMQAAAARETSTGMRAWSTSGRQRYRVLAGQRVFALQVAGSYAYARVPGGVRVVHVPSGTVVGGAAMPDRTHVTLLAP
jgi:hypothetical protein